MMRSLLIALLALLLSSCTTTADTALATNPESRVTINPAILEPPAPLPFLASGSEEDVVAHVLAVYATYKTLADRFTALRSFTCKTLNLTCVPVSPVQ